MMEERTSAMGQPEYEGSPEPAIAETREETDRKCPSCGGVMDFDPVKGMMSCPYCGYTEEVKRETEQFVAKELDLEHAEESANYDWGEETKTVLCKSCGAATVYTGTQISNECPYCGSNQVMEAGDSRVMAPGGVVLFRLDARLAAEKFRSWISKKFFCPKLAKESAKPGSFQGLYIPFWTFDADTESVYSGEYGIQRQVKNREGKTESRTDWYPTRGHYEESFDDHLVCGASSQNEALLSALEPFDTTQVVEYKPEYMAGFSAERYTVKLRDAWEKAKERLRGIVKEGVVRSILTRHRASTTRNVMVNTEFRNVTYKYLLLPVWISSFKYNDKVYHFMVNGQTGKVSGSTPVSWIKVAIVAAAVIAVIAAIMLLSGGDAQAAILGGELLAAA